MSGLPARGLHGRWCNQRTSHLELRVDAQGRLTGRFEPAGPLQGGHELTGLCNACGDGGATIGFVVAWPEAGSVTVWSGRYDAGADTITTTWLLAGPGEAEDWRATTIGHDVFRRAATSKEEPGGATGALVG